MGLFSRLFSSTEQIDFHSLMQKGVQIIDVRTRAEFKEAHIEKSINLPLQEIQTWCAKFKPGDELILVCRSGARAAMAKRTLKRHSIKAYNAKAWQNLQ